MRRAFNYAGHVGHVLALVYGMAGTSCMISGWMTWIGQLVSVSVISAMFIGIAGCDLAFQEKGGGAQINCFDGVLVAAQAKGADEKQFAMIRLILNLILSQYSMSVSFASKHESFPR